MINNIKYFFEKFDWMKVYFSPFKPPKPKLYVGKVAIGTPYFLPRRWVKNKEKKGYLKPVPKYIGFDFVDLGWKTKFDSYRFEWPPIWSFVFFKWQIAVMFITEEDTHFWECWLNYEYETNKKDTTDKRIKDAKEKEPCVWSRYNGDIEESICYWDHILKTK